MFVRSRAQIAVIAGFCAIFNSIFIIVLRQDPLLLRNPPQPPQDNRFPIFSSLIEIAHCNAPDTKKSKWLVMMDGIHHPANYVVGIQVSES